MKNNPPGLGSCSNVLRLIFTSWLLWNGNAASSASMIFYDEKDFFGKNQSSGSEKSEDSDGVSLLSDDDSLVEFYIRKY
ncbi:MAG: hypothetical protein V5A68_01885 [Candidatus Thermoplasmatota archaeon]